MRALAVLLALCLLAIAMILLPQPAHAGTFAVFQERFEGDWPGPWLVGDDNLSAGADYWGVTTHRDSQGQKSAWAAQEGTNNKTGLPNALNHRQDDSMDAYMRVDLGDLSGNNALSLSLEYWIESGSGDVFSVRVSDGQTWTTVWSLPGPVAQGWTPAETPLPLSTRFLEFRYLTAASHVDEYEGVYVDRVEVLAEDANPPSLAILSPIHDQWTGSKDVVVTWETVDTGSGIAFVEVRIDGGFWVNMGLATSLLVQGLAEGLHALDVRSVDKAGNQALQSIDFGVDVTSPSIVLLGPPEGSVVTSSSVELTWTAGDSVSGIAYYEVRLDSGPWMRVEPVDSFVLTGVADGSRRVTVRVVDLAGNGAETSLAFRVNTNPLHPEGPAHGALLYALVTAGALGLLVLLHRKGKVDLGKPWSRIKTLFLRRGPKGGKSS